MQWRNDAEKRPAVNRQSHQDASISLVKTQRAEPPTSRAGYVHAIRQHLAAKDVETAHHLARAGLADHPSSVQLNDLRIATSDYLGEVDQALTLSIANAKRRIRRLDRLRHRVGLVKKRHLGADRRTFLSGYFYSGSGAVLDYLRGFEGTATWSPSGEMRLIKSPGGMADLAARFESQGHFTQQDLVDMYLHITGWKITLTAPGTYSKWNVVSRNSRKLFAHEGARGYLSECLNCFLRLPQLNAQPNTTVVDVERHFRCSIERALDAAARDTGASHLLVDQAVNAWRLDIARFVPPSRFIVVHRDPRDQFAEARIVLKQPGRREPVAEAFARTYRKRRAVVDNEIERQEMGYGHRFLQV